MTGSRGDGVTDEQHCFPERTIGALCSTTNVADWILGNTTNWAAPTIETNRCSATEAAAWRPTRSDRSKQIWVNLVVDGQFQTLFVFPQLPPPPHPAGNAGRKQPPELEPQPATSQWTGPSCRTSDHSWTAAGDGSEANDGNLVQDQQDCSGLEREGEQLDFMKTIALDDIITIDASATSAFLALKVLGGAGDDHGTCR